MEHPHTIDAYALYNFGGFVSHKCPIKSMESDLELLLGHVLKGVTMVTAFKTRININSDDIRKILNT